MILPSFIVEQRPVKYQLALVQTLVKYVIVQTRHVGVIAGTS